jgi:TRAP-type C4-dicarboxylate transport system permease small subunit
MKRIKLGLIGLLRGLDILSTLVEKILTSAGVVFLIGMWGLLLVNTVARWISITSDWNPDTGWTLEIVGFMIVWSIFVMIGPVAKWDMHIKVNYFPEKLLGERRGASFIRMMENLTGLAVCIFMSIHTYRWIIETVNNPLGTGMLSSAGWVYPLWLLRLGLFVGFVSISFIYFQRTLKWIVDVVTQKEQAGELESGKAT